MAWEEFFFQMEVRNPGNISKQIIYFKYIKKEVNMSLDLNDKEKMNSLRKASQLKLAKDRVRSNRIIFMMKRPKPWNIQKKYDSQTNLSSNL
ncbi:hypothetical protein MHK_002512 [Candidatus Magnetomorum sp. HK-1]|nr:hypothetical protein MHK_002512 [Candidatus Magnetomorum sp. HK-1]